MLLSTDVALWRAGFVVIFCEVKCCCSFSGVELLRWFHFPRKISVPTMSLKFSKIVHNNLKGICQTYTDRLRFAQFYMLKSFGNDLYVAGQAIRVPFLGKSKSGFPNPKMDFAFVWANPRRDHESIKSTLLVDSFFPTDFVHLCNRTF